MNIMNIKEQIDKLENKKTKLKKEKTKLENVMKAISTIEDYGLKVDIEVVPLRKKIYKLETKIDELNCQIDYPSKLLGNEKTEDSKSRIKKLMKDIDNLEVEDLEKFENDIHFDNFYGNPPARHHDEGVDRRFAERKAKIKLLKSINKIMVD